MALKVFGPLRVENSDGSETRIVSRRGAAILGMLAIAPNHRRSKKWIQQILWPDRQPEQSSASFRQELRRLRNDLCETDALISTGNNVELNDQLISADVGAEIESWSKGDTQPPEFLEGAEFPSPPFHRWIRDHRDQLLRKIARAKGTTSSSSRPELGYRFPTILVELDGSRNKKHRIFGEIFNDLVVRGIKELGPVNFKAEEHALQSNEPNAAQPIERLKISATSMSTDLEHALRLGIVEPSTSKILWSGHWVAEIGKSELPVSRSSFLRFAFESQEAAVDAMIEAEELDEEMHAALLGFRARDAVFSTDPMQLKNADKDLKTAFMIHAKGIFQAWRAFMKANTLVEHDAMKSQSIKNEARELITSALQAEPDNGTISAIASHVLILLGDPPEVISELAQHATKASPSNPLGWSSLANVAILFNKFDEAENIGARALSIAKTSKHRYWWEMHSAVTASLLGDFQRAHTHCLIANSLAPGFKPPLRYLAALKERFHDEKGLALVLENLRKLEPNFEPNVMMEGDYPTGTLRKSGLLT